MREKLRLLRVAIGLANQWPLHLIWLVTFWSGRVTAHRLLASFPRHYQHRNKTTNETPVGKKPSGSAPSTWLLSGNVFCGWATSQLIRSSLRFFSHLLYGRLFTHLKKDVQILGIRKADAKNTGQSIQEPKRSCAPVKEIDSRICGRHGNMSAIRNIRNLIASGRNSVSEAHRWTGQRQPLGRRPGAPTL